MMRRPCLAVLLATAACGAASSVPPILTDLRLRAPFLAELGAADAALVIEYLKSS